MNLLQKTVEEISGKLESKAMEEAKEHLNNLLKPRGSFGRLEDLIVQLAGIQGTPKPQIRKKAVVMMCADNGVYAEGFHSYPQEITKFIAELSGDDGIIGSSVFARATGAQMVAVDVGVICDLQNKNIINKKVRYGTDNIAQGPAMTREEAIKAVEAGIEVTSDLIANGVDLIAVGEAGICNTTTSAAMLACFTGLEPVKVVGMGAGLDEKGLQQKIQVVEKALAVNKPDKNDPLEVLAKVGGLEIAGMVGCFLGCAAKRVPVVIDGFISGVAALTAVKIAPESKSFLFPSHVSAEQGAKIVLDFLGLKPYLTLDMRLGEGTGALMAFPIFDVALRINNEMGTFDDLKNNG